MEQKKETDKKSFTIYTVRKFITLFTRVHHGTLSWTSWIQSTMSHPVSLRSIYLPTYNQVFQVTSISLGFWSKFCIPDLPKEQ